MNRVRPPAARPEAMAGERATRSLWGISTRTEIESRPRPTVMTLPV